MKIHVVQKGETLWEISKKYGVDFNELKQVNSHLSNPDMIMPGMKIKIPGSSVQVKKQGTLDKEMKKYPADKAKEKKETAKQEMQEQYGKAKDKKQSVKQGMEDAYEKMHGKSQDKKDLLQGLSSKAKGMKPSLKDEVDQLAGKAQSMKEDMKKPLTHHPYKDTSPKSMPVIKEDDDKKAKKEHWPMKPMDIPKVPMMEQHMEKFPTSINIPEIPKYTKPKKQDQPETVAPAHTMPQQPVMPSYYPVMPCIPVNPVPYPVHTQPNQVMGAEYGGVHHYYNPNCYPAMNYPQTMPFGSDLMESSSEPQMPQMPQQVAGMGTSDCGCSGKKPASSFPDYDPNYGMHQGGYPAQMLPYGNEGMPSSPYQGHLPGFGGGFQPMHQQPGGFQYPGYHQQPGNPFQGGFYPGQQMQPGMSSGDQGFSMPYPPYSREEEEESE
ncbi:SafA/ExsA family spore coat assembly protein [Sediminibacillus massiliensis]|uniref:SafA/ExsA family spore coat assembly protein n=1 Tax=Sediminibacillus massiliensis TaxID=1926277 RepID=UPI000BAE52D7|nr:SafA/ExsA family spore coat assembly protein [Sediminibacillus massiliensis]